MTTHSYTIAFDYILGDSRFKISLSADVEVPHSELYYVVRNFRSGQGHPSLLPDLELKKVNGLWVHRDSEKETDLSIAVGKAIDRQEESIPLPAEGQ